MKMKKVFAGLCFTAVVACLFCSGFTLAAPYENESSVVRVMTQNMDAGTDFNLFAGVQTEADFEAALADTIEEIMQSKIPERADRLAAEIAVKKPDLIALQEVTTWEFAGESGPIVFNQLDLLMKALHTQGQHYQVAVVQTLTEIDMSVAKYSDSNAILVRTDMPSSHRLNIMGTETHLYEAGMIFPAPSGAIPLVDGWAAVDLKISGFRFKFVTTHLLGAYDAIAGSAGLQYDQAKQLVGDLLATNLPIILAGDFNSDAEPTHNYLNDATPSAGYIADSGYTDSWHALHPHKHGYTWPLYWEDQMSGQPIDPIERIDLIFSRGPVPLTATLAGTREGPNDVFASDHAGVVVDFHFQVKQHDAPKENH